MNPKKIVVLESNQTVADEVSECLKRCGLEVCGVTDDGAEGLQMIREVHPDAAVIGTVLKNIDGIGVLEQLKGQKIGVLMTGMFSDDAMIGQILAKGAKYYLIKPFASQVVAERILQMTADSEPDAVKEKRKVSLDEKISKIFISIGLPPHIKGYGYLREGIKMAVEDPSIINNITKQLYPSIAEHFSTSASKVERAIRHSIEVAWNRQRIDEINSIFGVKVYIGTDKPTNSEFIALVADKLLLDGLTE